MDPATQSAVRHALQAVLRDAHAAADAPDLDAAKAALNRVWFSVTTAQQTINEADNATRRAALDRLNLARTFA